jgi:hypothetical protein
LQVRRIVRDDDDSDPSLCVGLNVILQLPELRSTEGSPINGAHRKKYRSFVSEKLFDIVNFLAIVNRANRRELRTYRKTGIKRIRVLVEEHVVQIGLGLKRLHHGGYAQYR